MMRVRLLLSQGLKTADLVTRRYLEDFPTESWDLRPHPHCNHLNWQFGHLLLSEIELICGSLNQAPPISTTLLAAYKKPSTTKPPLTASDAATDLLTPTQLWAYYDQVRASTLRLLEQTEALDLDQPAMPSVRAYCPTIADAFLQVSQHWLMHSGQWVVLRRIACLPQVI